MWAHELMSDDGTLVKSSSNFNRGPYSGSELAENNVDICRVRYREFSRPEYSASFGNALHIPLRVRRQLNSPLRRNVIILLLLAVLAQLFPSLRGHGGQKRAVYLWIENAYTCSPSSSASGAVPLRISKNV